MNQDFADYVTQDLLSHISGITAKAMFGGYGIYKHGIIFALIADDELYFKVGESNIEDYKHQSSEPFIYTHGKSGKITQMPYWKLPPEIMDDPELLKIWVEKSVAVSKNR